MTPLDWAIIAILGISAAIGLVRGLVKEVLSLVAWIAAFVVAVLFGATVAAELPGGWGGETLRYLIAFVGLFVVTLIVAAILQWFVAQLVTSTGLSGTDRVLGFVFGGARGLLVAMLLLLALREIAGDAPWWRDAQLPPHLLAFEDELRELLGRAREIDVGTLVPEQQ